MGGGGVECLEGGGGRRLNANLRKPVYGRIGTQSQKQAARFLNATAGRRLRPVRRFGGNNHVGKYPPWSTRVFMKPKTAPSKYYRLGNGVREWQPFCFAASVCAQQQHAAAQPEPAPVSLKASSGIRAATPGCPGNRAARTRAWGDGGQNN